MRILNLSRSKSLLWDSIKLLSVVVTFGLLASCSTGSGSSPAQTTNNGNSAQTVTPVSQGIDVSPATTAQCPTGGQVYSVYVDTNLNGVRDSEETTLSSQIVCNGLNGQDGATGAVGAKGDTGDTGATGAKGDTGDKGDKGDTGATGANGHSVVFQTASAPSNVCSAGGTTLLIESDTDDDGLYDLSASDQKSITVCNGSDAPVPAYTPVEAIMPCGNTVAYKEVLLRLQSGQVLASFSNDTGGTMTRLSFLPDGTFMDTDDSGCTFSLSTSSDGALRSISWSGSVQMTWPMSY